MDTEKIVKRMRMALATATLAGALVGGCKPDNTPNPVNPTPDGFKPIPTLVDKTPTPVRPTPTEGPNKNEDINKEEGPNKSTEINRDEGPNKNEDINKEEGPNKSTEINRDEGPNKNQ